MGQHARRRPSPRRASVAAASVVLVASAGVLAATPAHADEGDRTAVIGPTLDFFGFGTEVGAPLTCGVISASVGSGFTEFGAGEAGNALVEGINGGCDAFAQQGTAFVGQGKVAQAPYAGAFNSFANPVIGQVAAAVTAFGTDYTEALAPFGPTVAGTGNLVNFFQGSAPK